MPVKCSSLPWRSFERSRLGLPRWEFCKPSWISGQEVWKIHLVSEIRLRGQPQISHCSVLLSNCVVLVHKSSRGGNRASFVWVITCVFGHYGIVLFAEVQDWGLGQGLQICTYVCEDPLLSPLLLCVKLSPLLLDLCIFSRETEKSMFYVKFPGFKKLGHIIKKYILHAVQVKKWDCFNPKVSICYYWSGKMVAETWLILTCYSFF